MTLIEIRITLFPYVNGKYFIQLSAQFGFGLHFRDVFVIFQIVYLFQLLFPKLLRLPVTSTILGQYKSLVSTDVFGLYWEDNF